MIESTFSGVRVMSGYGTAPSGAKRSLGRLLLFQTVACNRGVLLPKYDPLEIYCAFGRLWRSVAPPPISGAVSWATAEQHSRLSTRCRWQSTLLRWPRYQAATVADGVPSVRGATVQLIALLPSVHCSSAGRWPFQGRQTRSLLSEGLHRPSPIGIRGTRISDLL